MENYLFLYSDTVAPLTISRFHICTWELTHDIALVEIGGELEQASLTGLSDVKVNLFIPWLDRSATVRDLYSNLCDVQNSTFIFNESIQATHYLQSGQNQDGVIHQFSNGKHLCILPATLVQNPGEISISLDLRKYHSLNPSGVADKNTYFRILIETKSENIVRKKTGIGKSTILYDLKVNELRHRTAQVASATKNSKMCEVQSCYSFNIVPNRYNTALSDPSLKAIRSLEFSSFTKYLADNRLKNHELIVVFNKKEKSSSYSFFSIYNDEVLGAPQIILALIVNLVCGVLLFIPGYRASLVGGLTYTDLFFLKGPWELYVAVLFVVVSAGYIFCKSPKVI